MNRTTIWISVSLVLATIAFVPAASSSAVDPCDGDVRNCLETDMAAPTYRPYVEQGSDGSITVGYEYCSSWGCYRYPLVTANTCFTYDEDALVNACITRGSSNQQVDGYTLAPREYTVYAPGVTIEYIRICIIGDFGCNYYPVPSATPNTPYTVDAVELREEPGYIVVPSAAGYVEVTVACKLGAPCHLDFDDGTLLA